MKKLRIGPEVEQSAAFSKKTLFVNGKESDARLTQLIAEHKIQHVSITVDSKDTDWNSMVASMLDLGMWVTLIYPHHMHRHMLTHLNKNVLASKHFIPVIDCVIEHINEFSENFAIRFSDTTPNTNQGVWVWGAYQITDNNKLTEWKEYGNIEPVSYIDKFATKDTTPTPQPGNRVRALSDSTLKLKPKA